MRLTLTGWIVFAVLSLSGSISNLQPMINHLNVGTVRLFDGQNYNNACYCVNSNCVKNWYKKCTGGGFSDKDTTIVKWGWFLNVQEVTGMVTIKYNDVNQDM